MLFRSAIDTKYVGFTVGPHEECAVEEAVRLIEAHGGESVVLTLGPAEALDQLRDAMDDRDLAQWLREAGVNAPGDVDALMRH